MFERVVKYALHTTEVNNFKANITERLVERYIRKVLIPDLIKQGWSHVIFEPRAWFSFESESYDQKLVQKFFIDNSLYPTKEFFRAFEKLTRLLKNIPDGFLVKLRRTRKTKPLKRALKELGLESCDWEIPLRQPFTRSEHDSNEQLPIVEGEIEIVEVKTGKAIFPSHQMISYRKVLEEKYVLRFFHVNIISFEKNEFEIEEKIVTNPKELETVQKKERKRSARCNQQKFL
jgi:hypothetical protein